ncbi:MAG: hypothetical protein HY430_02655 [Candidatus Levybacteria bacterium]|nr:hypothetical protein [Candidatus Levybacteria bacterium]
MSEHERVSPSEAEYDILEIRNLLGKDLPTREFLASYKPDTAWFMEEAGGIHGVGHEARVLVLQELLAILVERQDGIQLDHEALRVAAITHDVRRINHKLDFAHGERAAHWIGRQQELKERISPSSMLLAQYINHWHVPNDTYIPNIPPELSILKDADGLDRVRLGDVDPSFFRHDFSKNLLLRPAALLFEATSQSATIPAEQQFDFVLDTAANLGMIRP